MRHKTYAALVSSPTPTPNHPKCSNHLWCARGVVAMSPDCLCTRWSLGGGGPIAVVCRSIRVHWQSPRCQGQKPLGLDAMACPPGAGAVGTPHAPTGRGRTGPRHWSTRRTLAAGAFVRHLHVRHPPARHPFEGDRHRDQGGRGAVAGDQGHDDGVEDNGRAAAQEERDLGRQIVVVGGVRDHRRHLGDVAADREAEQRWREVRHPPRAEDVQDLRDARAGEQQ
mmetsp:Transcript_65407/g.108726  ORF Transcript_65407/g.108726 Transcript_65407/m.108726 type:complete len:224 (-) Transcript_65407:904-1575(-)